MNVPDDLIQLREAVSNIQEEMKRIFTPPRRQGYKASIDILLRLPRVKARKNSCTLPTVKPRPFLRISQKYRN